MVFKQYNEVCLGGPLLLEKLKAPQSETVKIDQQALRKWDNLLNKPMCSLPQLFCWLLTIFDYCYLELTMYDVERECAPTPFEVKKTHDSDFR